MESDRTEKVIVGLAKIGADKLTADIDFLADKLDAISQGLQEYAAELKKELAKPEALLMLPAPEPRKKTGGKNTLCPVCKKFCKKGETIHQRCKEQKQ